MKKTLLLLILLSVFAGTQAQWTDNHEYNSKIASSSPTAGEIYLATNENTGDTYVQWCAGATNGWSPFLQRLNQEGKPQWAEGGIHIAGISFSSSSEGISMVTTADGCVVSCFADYEGNSYAVKIDPDGNFVWGEQGIQLFNGLGFSRTELAAGTDGGFWALGSDYNNSYIQYVNADGTLNPTNTISTTGKKCVFGQLTLSNDNNVFLTYEQLGSGFFTDKTIHVVGFRTDGSLLSQDIELMASQTFQSTYIHHVVPDGMGGGYVYIWHSGMDAFNTYVFHFDADGTSTIDNPNGISVHSEDPANYYLDAYATVDPISHDLIIAYQQTDSYSQSQNNIYVNRITTTGEKVWDEGISIYSSTDYNITDLTVDAFADGSGFAVIYLRGPEFENTTVIESAGYDMSGTLLWTTIMSSSSTARSFCENSTGFHQGQNIVAWTNADNGGIFGQNIHPDGIMGIVVEPTGCPGPVNFQGEYLYDMEAQDFGARLFWDEPTDPVEYYRVYRTDLSNNEETVIELLGGINEYYDQSGIGSFKYQLRALYADLDCGYSMPATTPTGEDHLIVEVTDIQEHAEDTIVTVLKVYTMTGQIILNTNYETLSTGVYILQGLNQDGKLINQKVYIP